MLQTKFYDTLRFKSEEEAENNNEIYSVKYQHPKMIITDPDGKEIVKPLNYRPVAGLDVSDHQTLNEYFNEDMERREREANER